MKKWRNKILSAVLVLSLLLTSSSFAFAVGDEESSTESNYTDISVTVSESTNGYNGSDNTRTIDNRSDTFWESITTENPYITFKLDSPTYISKIEFTPRQGNQYNGTPKIMDIYISDDNTNWIFAKRVDWNGLSGNTQIQEKKDILFDSSVKAQYVKLTTNSVYTDSSSTTFSIAEIDFYKDNRIDDAIITTQPTGGDYSEGLSISVTASEGASYQWYMNSENSYEGATKITDGVNSSYSPQNDSKYYFVSVTKNEVSVLSNIVHIQTNLPEAEIERTEGNLTGSLADMITAAAEGDTVKVLRNVDLSNKITINKKITITSSGEIPFTIKRISGNNGTMFDVAANGNLTFDNIIVDGGAVWGNGIPNLDNYTNTGISANSSIVELTTASSKFTLNSSATLQNNYNNATSGGAVRCDTKTTDTVININGTIQNCVSYFNNGYPNGGALSAACTVNLNGAKILNNLSKGTENEGGAVQVYNVGVLNVESSTFTGNTTNLNGGAIEFAGATMTVSNSSFTNNKANGNGGAIYIVKNTATFDECTFSNNNAVNGGVIYVAGGTVDLNTCEITGNTATTSGGAVYVNSGTTNINGGTFSGNTAINGGVVYVAGGTVDLNTCEITGNTATTSGGALYLNGGTANIKGGTFSENTATNGGALYLNGGTANLGEAEKNNTVKISGNTASKNGNGIYFNGTTVNINAILNLDDNIYYQGNGGKSIAINTDLTGSKPITIINADDRGATQLLNVYPVNDDLKAQYMSAALNVVRVVKAGTVKGTAFVGSSNTNKVDAQYKGEGIAIHYMPRNIKNSVQSDPTFTVNENIQTAEFYKGITNQADIFNSSISDNSTLYYKWFILNTETGLYEEMNISEIANGSYKAYCVITTQENDLGNTVDNSGFYYVTNVIDLNVQDFVPCSKAIDKFKNL